MHKKRYNATLIGLRMRKKRVMKAFETEWTAAYQVAINANSAYAHSGAKWTLGKIALVLKTGDGAGHGVVLDLLEGKCLNAQAVSASAAEAQADFVIVGDESTWRDVLGGQLAPLMGIMRGKLKLTKGSIARLLPFTNAANELVKSAQSLKTEF